MYMENSNYRYLIYRTNRNNLRLTLRGDGTLSLYCPRNYPKSKALDFIRQNAPRLLERGEKRDRELLRFLFGNSDSLSLLYFGLRFPLYYDGTDHFFFDGQRFHCPAAATPEECRAFYKEFLRAESKRYIPKIVKEVAAKNGLPDQGGIHMFQMLLVLALVAAVCAGVPSLLIAYANGKIALPRWLPGLLAFCCVLLAAMAWFPLSIDGAGAFVLYGFVGYCLRRAYTKTNVLPCMAFVLASSCVGLGAKWLICRLGVIREVPAFSPAEILAFLVLAQIAALLAFWITADPPPKKKNPYEKPVRRRRI